MSSSGTRCPCRREQARPLGDPRLVSLEDRQIAIGNRIPPELRMNGRPRPPASSRRRAGRRSSSTAVAARAWGEASPVISEASRRRSTSGLAPMGVPTTTVPQASASAVVRPNPSSSWVGMITRSAARYQPTSSSSETRPSIATCCATPRERTRARISSSSGPAPASTSRASGTRCVTSANASTSSLTPVRGTIRRAVNTNGPSAPTHGWPTGAPGEKRPCRSRLVSD